MRPIRQTARTLMGIALVIALPLASACDDAIDTGGGGTASGGIEGTISYDGAALVTRIGVAVFDSPTYPPTTPPVQMFFIPEDAVATGIAFPQTYVVPPLAAGTYYLMAYGDVDPDDGPFPKTIDPASAWRGPFEISEGSAGFQQDLVLTDGGWQGGAADVVVPGADGGTSVDVVDDDSGADDTTTPAPGKAALYGTISYDGDATGKLIIVGFESREAEGMPQLIEQLGAVEAFPADYALTDVTPGTYWIVAYLDTEDDFPPMPTDDDPISGDPAELTLTEGVATRLDLSLALP